MTAETGRKRKVNWARSLAWIPAIALVGVVLLISAVGIAPISALGPLLNPGTGVWNTPISNTAVDEEVDLPGMDGPGSVGFETNGLAHVQGVSDLDVFRMIGYTHARFRLTQMELMRRQGSGELAELVGESALESDIFARNLGLRRAAERDWRLMDPGSESHRVLEAYAAGVNGAISELEQANALPTALKALGVTPRPWTPVDTLVAQRVVTQTVGFNDYALVFGYAAASLPEDVFNDWFPPVAKNAQRPFDKGPYVTEPLEALPVQSFPDGPTDPAGGPAGPADSSAGRLGAFGIVTGDQLLETSQNFPDNAVAMLNHSNSWVVSGALTSSGRPLLAADPHLEYTLPPIWFQLEARGSSIHFTGATVPGIPVPLAGKTDAISWGVTASQRPTTLFYAERTQEDRPDQYLWRGEWRRVETLHEQIKVRGGGTHDHVIRLTAHGPLVDMQGRNVSVWWSGSLPSDNIGSVLKLLRASDPAAFRAGLDGWKAPAVNFSYADATGNIAMYNVGVAPQVPGHDISLPLPGTGEADVAGTIANSALPKSINPPEGFIESSNQREAGADYPYQYSSSYNYPNPGWQDDQIAAMIQGRTGLTAQDMAEIQLDWHDDYARQLVPHLLDALRGEELSNLERQLVADLERWDYNSSPDSISAGFFEQFKNRVSYAVFAPWWEHYGVQQNPVRSLLPYAPTAGSLATDTFRADIVAWLQAGDERWFNLPGGVPRSSTDVLRAVFHEHVEAMIREKGADLENWRYGKSESLRFPSIFGIEALQRGPFPEWGGNPRSINASIGTKRQSDGKPIANVATGGPSWRLIVDWGAPNGAGLVALPGGQSEDPSSPWYDNGISTWMNGEFWMVHEGPDVPVSAEWRVR